MHIIGHKKVRSILRSIAEGGSSHQAFIFSGPEGVGKSLVAREFSSRIMGISDHDPLGHQDFFRIAPDREDGKVRKIPVETIRDLGVFLSRFPAEARMRVAVLEDADTLSEQAHNALLKVFEEPNPTSVIILSVARIGMLPDTVRSRAFQISLGLVTEEDIRSEVRSLFSEKETAALEPFFFSLGRPGLVVSAIQDEAGFSIRREYLRKLFRISQLSVPERLSLSEDLSEQSEEACRLLEWWVSGMRSLRKNERDSGRLRSYYRVLEDTESVIRSIRETNANQRLLLDRLFLSF